MVRYRGSFTTKHARTRVWHLLSDWTRLADWDMNVKGMAACAGTPTRGVGAEWDCKFEFNGRKTDARYRCVQWTDSTAVFEATTTFVRSRDTIEVVEAPDGTTQVTAEFQLFLRGLLYPLSFTLDGAMQSTCPVVMSDLEKYVDQQLADH